MEKGDVEMAVMCDESEPVIINDSVEKMVNQELMQSGYLREEAPTAMVKKLREKHTLHQRLVHELGLSREKADEALKVREKRLETEAEERGACICCSICWGMIGLLITLFFAYVVYQKKI